MNICSPRGRRSSTHRSPPTSGNSHGNRFSLDNRWYVRRNPSQHRANLRLESMEDAIEEVMHYHRAGATQSSTSPRRGQAPTRKGSAAWAGRPASILSTGRPFTPDIPTPTGSTPALSTTLPRSSRATSPTGSTTLAFDQVSSARSAPPATSTTERRKVLRAGARASLETGTPVSVHAPSDRDPEWPPPRRALQVLDILEDGGAPWTGSSSDT